MIIKICYLTFNELVNEWYNKKLESGDVKKREKQVAREML